MGLKGIAAFGTTHPQGDDSIATLLCDLSGLCASAVALDYFQRRL